MLVLDFLFHRKDEFDCTIEKILRKKDAIMLNKLMDLFDDNKILTVTQILGNCQNFIHFLDQKLEGDEEKINAAIDHLKAILDSHKK